MSIKVEGILEDITYSAERGPKLWKVKVFDPTIGAAVYKLTDEQFGACLALMAAGDFKDSELNKKLWLIAESSMRSVRIFP